MREYLPFVDYYKLKILTDIEKILRAIQQKTFYIRHWHSELVSLEALLPFNTRPFSKRFQFRTRKPSLLLLTRRVFTTIITWFCLRNW